MARLLVPNLQSYLMINFQIGIEKATIIALKDKTYQGSSFILSIKSLSKRKRIPTYIRCSSTNATFNPNEDLLATIKNKVKLVRKEILNFFKKRKAIINKNNTK